MSVQIRPPRSGDGEGMARVWLTAGAYYADLDPAHFHVPSAEGLAASFEADIKATSKDSDKLRLVADRDNLVAGWLTAHVEHPYTNAAHQQVRELGWTRLVVDALMVDQAVWRQGTGTALLEAAESWGRERGAVVVRLHTYPDSPVSVPFYERHMGYERRSILFQKSLLPSGTKRAQHVLHDAAVPVVLRLARGVDPHDRVKLVAVG
jgi:GNAT superfamily N-acetyltransferase